METIKQYIKDKYTAIALNDDNSQGTNCCGSCCCGAEQNYTVFNESYSHIEGYLPDADLGLGCGLPTEYAMIAKGNTVLDLGSGAGNDCFVARALVGDDGYVAGIDFSNVMVNKARKNATKLGYTNVDFIEGDIEKIPVNSNVVDVVVSNCVLNLVPDKERAFNEIFRVLKHNAHFCISDVVSVGNLPAKMFADAEMYASCIAGSMQRDAYLDLIKSCGFQDVEIKKEKRIELTDSLLLKFLSAKELQAFRQSDAGVYSIIITARKPAGCRCVAGV